MEPASEEDIIWEVSPFVVAELLPDAMVHKKGVHFTYKNIFIAYEFVFIVNLFFLTLMKKS